MPTGVRHELKPLFGGKLRGKNVAVLGLTFRPNTTTCAAFASVLTLITSGKPAR